MMSTQNPVYFPGSLLQDSPSPDLDELFSLFQPDPTIQSTSSSETNRSVYSPEERKRRRMISNRESARRSRWRKKKQYEDLMDELNRLKLENRELKNWLGVLANDCHTVQRDSNRLLTESIYLQHSLAGLHELLAPNCGYNN